MAFTPTDPTKAEVRTTQNGTQLEFDFYFPQGPKGDPGGITVGTVLGTGNLDEIKTSGVYRQTSAANATPLNNYPEAGLGVLVVHEVTIGTHLEQQFFPFWFSPANRHGSVFYRRQFVNGAWSPWKSYPHTRVDQSSGRTFYTWDPINQREQLTYGDTGWREVPVTAVAGKVLPGGSVRYRRRGHHVEMAFVGVLLDTSANGYTDIIGSTEVPVGFRPHAQHRSLQAIGLQNNALGQQWITNYGTIGWVHGTVSGAYSVARPTVALYGSITWTTEEVWPSTLPGTAVGTISNT